MTTPEHMSRPQGSSTCEPRAATLRLTSRELFCGGTKLVIDHEGTRYTLQLTRQNKLLLTK